MHSVWEGESLHSPYDVCIVGAGLTGLISSILFKRKSPHLNIGLLEKGFVPEGASVKNAGFACFGSVSEILDDINLEGESKALDRVQRRFDGLEKLKELVPIKSIGYQLNGGYEIFRKTEAALYDSCKASIDELNAKLRPIFSGNCFEINHNTYGLNTPLPLIKTPYEASVDSGLLIKELMRLALSLGVNIRFNCAVSSFEKGNEGWELSSGDHRIKCNKLVLTTNGFSNHLVDDEPIVPGRGQIVLTKPISNLKLKGNFHLDQGYFYFREYKNRILLGGGRHLDRENESTDSQEVTTFIQKELERVLSDVILPNQSFEIERRWAGTMAFGPNNEKEAIIKEKQADLFIGVRLGGMGVAVSAQVANQLTDLTLKN